MANVNISDISLTTSELVADESNSAAVADNISADSENAIPENSTMEVHNDEQAQTEVSAAEQSEYSAVSSVPEEYEAVGAKAAVSEVSEETGISGATESVVSDVP